MANAAEKINKKYAIRMMKADDYDQAFVLWNSLEGWGLSEADSRGLDSEGLDSKGLE